MEAYWQIQQGMANHGNQSFSGILRGFQNLDPQRAREARRQEEAAEAHQMHAARTAATTMNTDRVAARSQTNRATHKERITKIRSAQAEHPQFEKRKPGRPKKLPLPAADPPARATNPSPS